MKVYIYDKWLVTIESGPSPVRSASTAVFKRRCTNRSLDTINRFKLSFNSDESNNNGKYLTQLKDKDYSNEFIGSWDECVDFIKICLSDANIIKESLGRKRIKE